MLGISGIERECRARGFRRIAGLDEAGRGPLAGPVVAAAVLLAEETEIPGVDDSKKLSTRERGRLFDEIHSRALAVGVGAVSPREIDERNILQASILAMHLAVERLPLQPEFLLVDGNRFHHPRLPFRTVVRGDASCLCIAAASIIAKVTRDRIMVELDALYPEYGFARHKGYPTRRHIDALREFGPSEIHRRSFVVKQLQHITMGV